MIPLHIDRVAEHNCLLFWADLLEVEMDMKESLCGRWGLNVYILHSADEDAQKAVELLTAVSDGKATPGGDIIRAMSLMEKKKIKVCLMPVYLSKVIVNSIWVLLWLFSNVIGVLYLSTWILWLHPRCAKVWRVWMSPRLSTWEPDPWFVVCNWGSWEAYWWGGFTWKSLAIGICCW